MVMSLALVHSCLLPIDSQLSGNGVRILDEGIKRTQLFTQIASLHYAIEDFVLEGDVCAKTDGHVIQRAIGSGENAQ